MEQDPAVDKSAPTAITQAIQALLDRRGVPERKRLGALEADLRLAFVAAFPGLDSRRLQSLPDRYDRAANLLENLGGLQRARSQSS